MVAKPGRHVGQHGGDAGGPTATQAQQRVTGDPAEKLGAEPLQKNDSDQNEDDPTQGMAEEIGGDSRHDPPTGKDADEGGGQQGAEKFPGRMCMKRKHAHDIRRDEQGKNHSGGFPGG